MIIKDSKRILMFDRVKSKKKLVLMCFLMIKIPCKKNSLEQVIRMLVQINVWNSIGKHTHDKKFAVIVRKTT